MFKTFFFIREFSEYQVLPQTCSSSSSSFFTQTLSLPSTQSPLWTTTLSSRNLLILTLPLFDLSLPTDWVLWNGIGLNRVLKLDHGAFMDEWRWRDHFGWWVGWIRGLCIGWWWVLCVVVKPQIYGGCGLVWIRGLQSVVGGCCETQSSCWWVLWNTGRWLVAGWVTEARELEREVLVNGGLYWFGCCHGMAGGGRVLGFKVSLVIEELWVVVCGFGDI